MARVKGAIAMPDGVQALDVAGPVDVFAEAKNYLPFEEATGGFDIILVAGAPNVLDVAPVPPLIDK